MGCYLLDDIGFCVVGSGGLDSMGKWLNECGV